MVANGIAFISGEPSLAALLVYLAVEREKTDVPLILELPEELEAELLAHWQRVGLIEADFTSSADRASTQINHKIPGHFRLPDALQRRLQELLDRQDAGDSLTSGERFEAEGLVELAELLSLLHLRFLSNVRQN